LFEFVKRYLFASYGDAENGGRVHLEANKMRPLIIHIASEYERARFLPIAIQISQKSKILYDQKKSIITFIKQEYGLNFNSTQLRGFTELGWNQISELLTKQKINLSVEKKEEFSKWIKEKQKYLFELQNEVTSLDTQINQEVYKLYELTDEEIRIVEGKKI
jgi:hypothetical protein